MSKRKRGNRGATLVVIFICVAIAFAAVWGITTAVAKLMNYGNETSVTKREEPPSEEEEVQKEDYVIPEQRLPRNQYDTEKFYEENGLKKYNGQDAVGVAGIDVSSYQKEIDWQAVKEAGIEFAMIRLGYRGYVSGALDLDDCFLKNMEGAADAGIQIGVYFFSQALNEEEAVEEAEFVVNWLRGYDIAYPVVFDWEEVNAEARTDSMHMVMLTNCAVAFCEKIKEAGYTPGVYFNQIYGYQILSLPSLEEYVFWLAEYNDTPEFAYDFTMWQYTNEGKVPGISGPVDLNIAFRKK